MRVLFVGDMHFSEQRPKFRTDDYLYSGLEELRWILGIATKSSCDAVVYVGDVFDRMDVSGRCRNAVMRTFQKCSGGVHQYVCVGNHDVDDAPENLPHSALGTLRDAGLVQIVDYDDDLGITFWHWEHGIEEDIKQGGFGNNSVIHVAHAYILTESAIFGHVLFEDINVNAECRLVVAGHYHPPLDAVRADGVRFINPGAIARETTAEHNLTRQPQVLLVDYERDGSRLECQYIPVACSLPGAQIFAVRASEAEKEGRKTSLRFVQRMSQVKAVRAGGDKESGLVEAAERKSVRQPVIDNVLSVFRTVRSTRKGIGE